MSDNLDTHFDEVETNDFPTNPPTPDRGDELRERANNVIRHYSNGTCECDGEVGMSPCENCGTAQTVRDLLAQLDEQRAVIERLPKTADGKPVCPGDSGLYGVNADCEIVEHCIAPHYFMAEGGEYEAWHIKESGGFLHDHLIPMHEAYPDEAWYGRTVGLYSTKEACESAFAASGGSDE